MHSAVSISSPLPSGNGSSVRTPPASASGVMTPETSGIAKALASGLMRETDEKNRMPSGSSETVAATCVRPASASRGASQTRSHDARGASARLADAAPGETGWNREPCQTIAATAANDSQKPAAIGAHGSATQTMAAAVHRTSRVLRARPLASASPAAASIQQVRCAGRPQPASAE